MKKEVTKTIPAVKARPASIKKSVVAYCDFCPKRSADHYGNERKCMACGRDICQTHQHYDPQETGDYGGHYCPSCIKLYYDKYQKLIIDMSNLHYEQEEDLIKQMGKESFDVQSIQKLSA